MIQGQFLLSADSVKVSIPACQALGEEINTKINEFLKYRMTQSERRTQQQGNSMKCEKLQHNLHTIDSRRQCDIRLFKSVPEFLWAVAEDCERRVAR